MIIPVASFAANSNEQTITTLQAQIQALQHQISSLLESRQSHESNSVVQGTPLVPSSVSSHSGLPPVDDRPGDEPPQTSAISFDRDLYYGLRNDSDVSNLQEFLIDQGFLKGSVTGNYFILTQSAVKRFQIAHRIKASGYFGPITRVIANQILVGK